MLFTRFFRFFLLFIFTSILLTGCNKKLEVRVAYFPNITHAQGLFMKSEGMLERKLDNIAVKWIPFNAGPSEIEAMSAGQIDIGYVGPVPAVSGYVQSYGDIKIIAGASNGGSILVARRDAEINTATDLDGKNVAIPQFGNTQHLSLLSLLNSNRLAPASSGGSVNIVQAQNADIVNLMDQEHIDAALVPEPWGSILELKHNAKVVLDYNQIDKRGIPSTAVVIARKDFLNKHRDIVEKFMEAHKEATLYINENDVSDVINTQIAEVTNSKLDVEILKSAFRRLEVTYEIPTNSIMDFAKISLVEGFIPKFHGSDIIDDSFVK